MKTLPEILEEAREALLGRKSDHRWGSSASDAYKATVEGLKGVSGDALAKTASSFNDALPYIERAGYHVTEIEVGLGLSPKAVAHLELATMIPPEGRDALLDEVRERALVRTILQSLFRAADAREKLRFRGFHFTDMELELSVLPSVSLKFKPNVTDTIPATPPAATDGQLAPGDISDDDGAC